MVDRLADAKTRVMEKTKEPGMQCETKKDSEGPELETWVPKLGSIPPVPITRIRALGDIHGWAPGLITYLIHHQLAKIELNGLPLYSQENELVAVNEENMRLIFRNPRVDYLDKGTFNPSGLKDYEIGEMHPQPDGYHSIKAEWIGDPGTAFIQMGDVFDRGDYSELTAEILRQLLIQAPFRVFVLLGNHEQFLVENDFRTWLHNEQRFYFNGNLDEVGFHTRFHEDSYSWEISDEDTLRKNVFDRYRYSATLLYLTQYSAQSAVLQKMKGKHPEVDVEKVLAGGWGAYRYAKHYAETRTEAEFPGAFVLLGLGHAVFVHAGPRSFHDVNIDLLKHHIKIIDEEELNLVFSEYRMSTGSISDSEDTPLLWSRGGESGVTAESPRPIASEYMEQLVGLFPGVRHLVHGHSPTSLSKVFSHYSGNNPVSYLARIYGERPSPAMSSVRIHVIDEGLTPVYFNDSTVERFNPTRLPIGLVVHPELVAFVSEARSPIERQSSDWFKVNDSSSSPVFSIPRRVVLTIPSGIGSIEPGVMIWSSSITPDPSVAGRYVAKLGESHLNLCAPSPRTYLPNTGFAFLLYPKDQILSPQTKTYLLEERSNTPIDTLLLEYLTRESNLWLTMEDKEFPFGESSEKERIDWSSLLYEPETVFGKTFDLIQEHGLESLVTHAGAIFVLFGLNKKSAPYSVIMNGTNTSVHLAAGIVESDGIGEEIQTEVEGGSWHYLIMKEHPKQTPLYILSLSAYANPLPQITQASLKQTDEKSIRSSIAIPGSLSFLLCFDKSDIELRHQSSHGILELSPRKDVLNKESVTARFGEGSQPIDRQVDRDNASSISLVARFSEDTRQAENLEDSTDSGIQQMTVPRPKKPKTDSEGSRRKQADFSLEVPDQETGIITLPLGRTIRKIDLEPFIKNKQVLTSLMQFEIRFVWIGVMTLRNLSSQVSVFVDEKKLGFDQQASIKKMSRVRIGSDITLIYRTVFPVATKENERESKGRKRFLGHPKRGEDRSERKKRVIKKREEK